MGGILPTRGALLFAIALLTIALPGSGASEASSFAWNAPDDTSGNIVVGLDVLLDGEQECVLSVAVAGRLPGAEPMQIFASYQTPGDAWWTTFYAGHYAQAHTGPLDTREILAGEGGLWATRTTITRTLSGPMTITAAGFNLEAFGNTVAEHPFEIDLSCDGAFTVEQQWLGRSVVPFTHDNADGGTGASVFAALPSVSLAVDDGVTGTFDEAQVRLRAGEVQVSGKAIGTMTLEHPEGQAEWSLGSDEPIASKTYAYDGPTGAYDLRFTRIGAGAADIFAGVLAGLDPVDGLDEGLSP